jgi:hypothetical protein
MKPHQASTASQATGTSLLSMRTPAHRATTRNLQALYPYIVDSALGSHMCGTTGSTLSGYWSRRPVCVAASWQDCSDMTSISGPGRFRQVRPESSFPDVLSSPRPRHGAAFAISRWTR